MSEANPLQILIAGAGIGGLAAGIAFRREGHIVQIFESSAFAQEIGAAVGIPPNANGLVRRLGLVPEENGAVTCTGFKEFNTEGEMIGKVDMEGIEKEFGYPWQLIHRVDFHNALKTIALSPEGPGLPVVIHLRSRVAAADPENGLIILENGKNYSGDVIIGADGVHSHLRTTVLGAPDPSVSSGNSTFRFMIPVPKITADPNLAAFTNSLGKLLIYAGDDRRVIMYPCRNMELLNLAASQPANLTDTDKKDWNNHGKKEDLERLYSDFSPELVTLLSKVDENSVKLHILMDKPALRTWVNGRVGLLGDAAHPFLPFQGQGAAQAIEDATSLGVLLPMGTTSEEVPERLKLYEKCRYERATRIQDSTRESGRWGHKNRLKDLSSMEYNLRHDEYEHSRGVLRRFLRERGEKGTGEARL
ncbi:FAD/NAD(P)-binding domain-containing protein [Choiromyces venosus 120613-1]|uniref:FAD/NAD(P)-binding domain-containing protein n=1 Tax=Choiromyces venosus 120613-1 TaxID=1336337 RepID=A0A3N4K432_9PEZI|nr:FAD/NAD(P)-binding domain-containing protein [Choiromyces venosus 120613-1]